MWTSRTYREVMRFLEMVFFSLSPDLDKRRRIGESEDIVIRNILKRSIFDDCGNFLGIRRNQKAELSDAYILANYNDCVSHIKDYQKSHWIVFSWLFATQVALLGGFIYIFKMTSESYRYHIVLLAEIVIFSLCLFGLVFMNEISVSLERNRRHLDTLRIIMGGNICAIYINVKKVKKNGIHEYLHVSRQDQKRYLEIVMHWTYLISFFLISVLVISFPSFANMTLANPG